MNTRHSHIETFHQTGKLWKRCESNETNKSKLKISDKGLLKTDNSNKIINEKVVSDTISNHNSLSFDLISKGLNFGHLNVQGICGKNMCKFSEIKAMLTAPENKFLHVFGISETKLKQHKMSSCFDIDGFQKPFRSDNTTNGGGGIMVYVRNGVNAKRRKDLETNEISCIWLEITPVKSKSFLICNMYRAPDSKIEFNDRFENFIDNASSEGKEIIILGDFNKNLLNNNKDNEWENFTTSLGLSQLISNPTRVSDTSCTLIDHIYTNVFENIARVHVSKITISDHYAVFGNRKLNSCIKTNGHHTITYRSFKTFDETLFKNDLCDVPWEIIETFDNIDDVIEVWNTLFLEVVNKHAPLKVHRVKRKYQPDWLTPEILDCIKERDKYKINDNMLEYRRLRNKVSTLIDNAKRNSYKCKIEDGKDDPRSIWKLFRQLGASNNQSSTENFQNILLNNKIISSEEEIANIFNTYFVNVASKLKEPLKPSNFDKLQSYVNSKLDGDVSFSVPQVSFTFVANYLSALDTTKATGLDGIGPRLLKIAPHILAPSITNIINKSLESGIFPSAWKEAKVSPIHKTGSKDDVNNYRPISILPTLSKIIEKWIQKKLMTFLDKHSLLHKHQSGFRAGHSTESALIRMTDEWLKAINDGKLIGSVMIDFRKAFDLVDHELLLKKLQIYKVNDVCLSWFRSYLCNRKQQVIINGKSSSNNEVLCGVPQGSILGPLLFLIFINDLPLSLNNVDVSVDLYADDTTLYGSGVDKKSLESSLQKALDLTHTWCQENGMLINTDKTKLMLITSRQKRNNLADEHLKVTYENLDLQISCSEKVLGVHIDQNLVWNSHFQHVSKKISSYLWLLSQIKTYLSVEHKLLFYNSYIKPHLEYCCIVWGNSSNFNTQKIDRLQRRACKYILERNYVSLEDSRTLLNILSFEETLFLHKSKLMYKIANNIAPVYLTELFCLRGADNDVNNTHLNLRSVSNKHFLIPKPKINLFKNSFSYSGALVWNSIPLTVKTSNTLESFSKNCLNWMRGK
ncbi:MAG: hypothetical protein JAY75_14385 [Candidatus Thiodiazotropha taylori]|nr:hypothetical protein [Candidatus Thiodiazotropha taylori]MCG8077413.1 hypothetical protein [Candidatus Thiodiazotropha taylori]MCG8095277.1 hypothetical protein [Candidatus Thiodiazotropha endolucinida]MCW4309405.1 reverse transcriptase domain-containing protein [Candidatus Thiodiazotropha endolucinida]MCW4334494.1 reverse transcriptase domain-containing protein [Candidatus Thiodiazotropha endolucinida]